MARSFISFFIDLYLIFNQLQGFIKSMSELWVSL